MGSAPMRFGGFLGEDAPDPRIAQAEKVRLMPTPVMGLVRQPSLDDIHMENTASSQGSSGLAQMSVSINYTLWRNPADHSDPVNLADLDEPTLRALDEQMPEGRPAWIRERIRWMRYPMLWEAVRTNWHRDLSDLSSPSRLLVEHTNHILVNQFRKQLGLGDVSTDRFAARLTERSVNPQATAIVEGVEVPAIEIDTDPFVYAIGVELASNTVLTAVIPRDELDYVRLEFARRTAPPIAAAK
jgi:hypothetical protein